MPLGLQIHIFNQRAIVALKQTHTCILLDKIDPKQCNPALLGPMPPSVHKLPFRLDDIPYFDTTFLCDPVMDKYYTPGTGVDSDDEWDAPLHRASTVAAKITVATRMPNAGAAGYQDQQQQYSQTNLSGLFGEFTNILEPYSREPNTKFNTLTSRRGSNVLRPLASSGGDNDGGNRHAHGRGTSLRDAQHQRSSQMSSPPNELRSRFEERTAGEYGGQRPGSLKKRAAPRIPTPPSYSAPIPPSVRRNSFGKKTHAPMVPSYKGYEFRGLNQSCGAGSTSGGGAKMNPVREMQLRGVQQRGVEVSCGDISGSYTHLC